MYVICISALVLKTTLDIVCQHYDISNISETNSIFMNLKVPNISYEQSLNSSSFDSSSTCIVSTVSLDSSHNQHESSINLHLSSKGINMDHLNIQGICGEKLGKFQNYKFC